MRIFSDDLGGQVILACIMIYLRYFGIVYACRMAQEYRGIGLHGRTDWRMDAFLPLLSSPLRCFSLDVGIERDFWYRRCI